MILPPELQVPYFPPVDSKDGLRLAGLNKSASSTLKPLIVHEICALQMLRARMDRGRFVRYIDGQWWSCSF